MWWQGVTPRSIHSVLDDRQGRKVADSAADGSVSPVVTVEFASHVATGCFGGRLRTGSSARIERQCGGVRCVGGRRRCIVGW